MEILEAILAGKVLDDDEGQESDLQDFDLSLKCFLQCNWGKNGVQSMCLGLNGGTHFGQRETPGRQHPVLFKSCQYNFGY